MQEISFDELKIGDLVAVFYGDSETNRGTTIGIVINPCMCERPDKNVYLVLWSEWNSFKGNPVGYSKYVAKSVISKILLVVSNTELALLDVDFAKFFQKLYQEEKKKEV